MEKIIGEIISKKSNKIYKVKYRSDDLTVWVKKTSNTWEIVCENVKSISEALECAQGAIDSQPDLF